MTTLYKKIGKRYKPVAEEVHWDSFPAGSYLMVVEPGVRVATRLVSPDYPAVEAALRVAQEAMVEAMDRTATRLGVRVQPTLDPDAIERAWAAFHKELGSAPIVLYGASPQDIADAGVAAIRKKAQEFAS